MKDISIGQGKATIPEIALGCMRINSLEEKQVEQLIKTAMELEINFFDHADIYGGKTVEAYFAKAIHMNDSLREKMILQSKASIRPGFFDASKKYILQSVDQSLKNLQTDYLDYFLLHRPDTLMEPEEVAEAFTQLKTSGKVKHFGVSNFNGGQISLLNKYTGGNILVHQLQLSIAHCGIIDQGFNVNMCNNESVDRDSGILDYCRLNDITIQAWSPFQYGFFEGVFIGDDKYKELNVVLERLGEKYNVNGSAIAVAWILRHPAKMQTIVGTTNKERLQAIAKASDIALTREEWYELYRASGKTLP